MDTTDISLPQPIEYVDTICLDKSVVLPDGCTTATLTTEDGEAVTLIVSQHIPENNDSSDSIKEIIEANDCDIIAEVPAEHHIETASEPKTVYAIHFPANSKNESFECFDNSENGAYCDDKSENSIDRDIQPADNSDIEDLHSTNLEDFMDVVTTYKCKFCRFSCPWKSGLVSHIRCCHISEKKCIVTTVVRAEKEPNIVTATKHEKAEKSLNVKHKESVEIKIGDSFSLNESQDVEELSQDSNKSAKSPKSETDSEQSTKGSPILERHIFLCGQCSDGFVTLDDCKQHMIDAHNIKLEQNMIKPLRKRGRPRKHPLNDDGTVVDVKSKRLSRPPKNLEKDYDYGVKKPRRENLNDRPNKYLY